MGEPEGKVELILLINYVGVLSSLIKNQILDPLSCVLLNKTRSGSRIFFNQIGVSRDCAFIMQQIQIAFQR